MKKRVSLVLYNFVSKSHELILIVNPVNSLSKLSKSCEWISILERTNSVLAIHLCIVIVWVNYVRDVDKLCNVHKSCKF